MSNNSNIKELTENLNDQIMKNQALKERIAALVSQYEDQDASRRVLITKLDTQLTQANDKIKQFEESLEPTRVAENKAG